MKTRTEAVERRARPAWDWDRVRVHSPYGWVALALAAAHVAIAIVMNATHTTYWRPDELWSDPWVVAAAVGLATTAIAGALVALWATLRRGERSILMLVPAVLGAFWAFWLLGQLPGWLG